MPDQKTGGQEPPILITPVAHTDRIVILCRVDLQGNRAYDIGFERTFPPRHPGGKPTAQMIPPSDIMIEMPEAMAEVAIQLREMAAREVEKHRLEQQSKTILHPGGNG